MEIMGDNAEEYDEVKRGDRTVAELAKAKRLLGEKEMELQKLQKMCVSPPFAFLSVGCD